MRILAFATIGTVASMTPTCADVKHLFQDNQCCSSPGDTVVHSSCPQHDQTVSDERIALYSQMAHSINWGKRSIAHAYTGMQRVMPVTPFADTFSNTIFYDPSKHSDLATQHLEPAAEEVWKVCLEVSHTPEADPDDPRDGVPTKKQVAGLIHETNKKYRGQDVKIKYLPDERSEYHYNIAKQNGLEYFTEMNQRDKIGDMQIEYMTCDTTWTIPLDPSDCWRAYASNTKEVDADPEVAYSQGSKTITVKDGISLYYPKLQYRDGTEPAVYDGVLTDGRVTSLTTSHAGTGFSEAPTEYVLSGGYDDARIAIDIQVFNWEINVNDEVKILHPGSGYIGNEDGTLPLKIVDPFANAYVNGEYDVVVFVDPTTGSLTGGKVRKTTKGFYALLPNWGSQQHASTDFELLDTNGDGKIDRGDRFYNSLQISVVGGRDFPRFTFVRDTASSGLVTPIITHGGSGFVSAPRFTTSGGHTWKWGDATAAIENGSIQSITLTQTGGYITDDVVVHISGDGTGASATVTKNPDGTLSPVTITNPGVNYTTVSVLITGGRPWKNVDRPLKEASSGMTFGPFSHFFQNKNAYTNWYINRLVSFNPETGRADYSGGWAYYGRLAQFLGTRGSQYTSDQDVKFFVDNYDNYKTQVPNSLASDPYVPEVGTVRPEFVLIPDSGQIVSSRFGENRTAIREKFMVSEADPTWGIYDWTFWKERDYCLSEMDKYDIFTCGGAGVIAHEFGHSVGLGHTGENNKAWTLETDLHQNDDMLMSNKAYSHATRLNWKPESPNPQYGLTNHPTITRMDGTIVVPPRYNIMGYGDSVFLNKEQRMVMRANLAIVRPWMVKEIVPQKPNEDFKNNYYTDEPHDDAKQIDTKKVTALTVNTDRATARITQTETLQVHGETQSDFLRANVAKIAYMDHDTLFYKGVKVKSPDGTSWLITVSNEGRLVTDKVHDPSSQKIGGSAMIKHEYLDEI